MPHTGDHAPDESGTRFTTRRLATFASPDLIGAIRLGLLREHGWVDEVADDDSTTDDAVVVTMADRRSRRERLFGEG